MKKKILIFGSRPNSYLCKSDAVYFVNSSVYHQDKINTDTLKYHVVGAAVTRSKKKDNKKRPLFNEMQEIVSMGDVNNTIILNARENDNINRLTEKGYKTENIDYYSKNDIYKILKMFIGRKPPIGKRYAFDYGFKFGLFYIKKYLFSYFNSNINLEKFRPSSGVLALLISIYHWGEKADYIISGIGLDTDSGYKLKSGYKNYPKSLRGHIFGDKYILCRIWRDYNVQTLDESLSQITGMPYNRIKEENKITT